MPERISLVTASFNQGSFIRRTIESVLTQRDPNLEHIVVDGMSRDNTPQILAEYPHLKIIREPDHGQADAINKGFRHATGTLFAFLNSDDTLETGALHRVRAEIDRTRNRHIVVGRCRFIDADDRFLGREHPSGYVDHARVLEIWKGHTIPQPATFWTREVWERCGPLNPREQLVLDYDLFCRFSKCYTFHTLDQVLANYRLHGDSKTCSAADRQVLRESLRISRQYWGPPTSWLYWRMLSSYASYCLDRPGRAMTWWQQGRAALQDRRWVTGLGRLTAFTTLAPDLFANLVVWPTLLRLTPTWFDRLGLATWFREHPAPPHTRAWLEYHDQHSDGWVGPEYTTRVEVEPLHRRVVLAGGVDAAHLPEPLELEMFLAGQSLGRQRIGRLKKFEWEVPLNEACPGQQELKIVANTYVTHHAYRGNGDHRPLSYQVRQLRLAG